MNLLFLAPRLPWPADTGGKIRTFNLLKQIAKVHKVTLASFSFEDNDADLASHLRDLGIDVHLIPSQKEAFLQKAAAVVNALPYSVGKYNTDAMRIKICSLIGTDRADFVHFDHIHMAHYQKYCPGLPSLVDEHNVEYKILERCASVEPFVFRKVAYSQQADKMKSFERENILKFSVCSAVSEDDAGLIRELTENKIPVHVVPNGVDTQYFQSTVDSRQSTGEDSLAFTGSMDWLPNNEAAEYFCKEILPIVWQTKPDVKFYIVGKNPLENLKSLSKGDKRIIVTGVVDDVRPFIAAAAAFVVPLRIGGGTRLKILEAMAMEKAVISTRIGAEGINCADNKNILLADTPQEFAEKILAVIDGKIDGRAIGKAGRELVVNQYDWGIVGKDLLTIYEKYSAKRF